MSTDVTQRLVGLGRRQAGLLTRSQAIREGATDRQIAHLVSTGVLGRVHPGIYALSGTPRDYVTQVRAAVLFSGREALASHESAAWLQGLLSRLPQRVHVTIPRVRRRRPAGIQIHQSDGLLTRRAFKGIPCTDPARTLIDLAATATDNEMAIAVDRALALGLVRLADLERAARDSGIRRGKARLRRCLLDRGLIGAPAPSVLESRFARESKRFGLPCANAEVVAGKRGQYRIDFAYNDIRLAVELYGYASHHTPEQLDADLARQRHLISQGWTVLIFTWKQLYDDPERVIGEILAAYTRLSQAA